MINFASVWFLKSVLWIDPDGAEHNFWVNLKISKSTVLHSNIHQLWLTHQKLKRYINLVFSLNKNQNIKKNCFFYTVHIWQGFLICIVPFLLFSILSFIILFVLHSSMHQLWLAHEKLKRYINLVFSLNKNLNLQKNCFCYTVHTVYGRVY